MIVEVFRKIDCSNPHGMEQLQVAVKSGYQFRPLGGRKAEGSNPPARRKRNRRAVYKIDDSMGQKMRRMRADGVTIRAIAKAFRLSVSGVGNYLKRTEIAGAA